ncbi:MAG: hypothetical protein ACREL4_04535 [Gemmatimonadales bacterium]
MALLALVLGATGGVAFHHIWLQDESPIIQNYRLVHGVSGLWVPFTIPYWPPPFSPSLYRPLSLALFALQWAAGDGDIWVFHLLNLVFYALSVMIVWRFARLLMPAAGAWISAALFAVHPVHVEAVALSVNQSEALVGILLISATAAYVDWRRRGNVGAATPSLILLIYLIGCLIKESAIVLPGLLLAAELTLIDDPTPWRERVATLRPWGLGLTGIAVVFLGIRTLVLQGIVGTFTAEGLVGLSWGGRLLTMLGVVPRWAALMFWPAHLQEDYSPGEIIGTDHWGPDQVIGALILVMAIILLVRSWRRNRVAAFGILWFLVAIFPVSNVVVSTGIILAERTLFLPSVGGLLALGALVGPIGAWLAAAARPWLARAAVGVTALVIACGLGRSYVRMRIWRDPRSLWSESMLDAPDSWRVNEAFAYMLGRIGEPDRFVYYMRQAIALNGRSARLNAYLANWFRHRDDCTSAGPLYNDAVRLDPRNELIRASQLACLMAAPNYLRARRVATIGRGYLPESQVLARIQAMSESLAVADPERHGVKITIDSLDPGLVKITGPAHP